MILPIFQPEGTTRLILWYLDGLPDDLVFNGPPTNM